MRRTFFDILNEMPFDIMGEYEKLLDLFFSEESIWCGSYFRTMSEYIDDKYFRILPIRGSARDVDELAESVGIIKNKFSNDLNDLFVFCEFLLAMMPEHCISIEKNSYYAKHMLTIIDNIDYILEKTNYERKKSPKYDDNYIIVEKNKATTLAAEIVEDIEVAYDLIEYNHYALKGDLEGKKKILFALGVYVEPILASKELSKNGYGTLESDAGFMLNNFHIRHNNKEGKKANDYIAAISDEDLEELYDKTYEAILSVIIINEHIPVSKENKTLKQTYTFKV